MFVKSIIMAAAGLSAAVSAAPASYCAAPSAAAPTTAASTTASSAPSKTAPLTGVTHRVTVGRSTLTFEPDNVVAAIGDIIEWHFHPKNHSVVEAAFGKPCEPLASGKGFNSGFMPVNSTDANTQGLSVFQVVVQDTAPHWYYCAQPVGGHCQKGMVGVFNQNFNSANTLKAFAAKAAMTNVTTTLPNVQGGAVIPNPDPHDGN